MLVKKKTSITTSSFEEALQFVATAVNEHSEESPTVFRHSNTFLVVWEEEVSNEKVINLLEDLHIDYTNSGDTEKAEIIAAIMTDLNIY